MGIAGAMATIALMLQYVGRHAEAFVRALLCDPLMLTFLYIHLVETMFGSPDVLQIVGQLGTSFASLK